MSGGRFVLPSCLRLGALFTANLRHLAARRFRMPAANIGKPAVAIARTAKIGAGQPNEHRATIMNGFAGSLRPVMLDKTNARSHPFRPGPWRQPDALCLH